MYKVLGLLAFKINVKMAHLSGILYNSKLN